VKYCETRPQKTLYFPKFVSKVKKGRISALLQPLKNRIRPKNCQIFFSRVIVENKELKMSN